MEFTWQAGPVLECVINISEGRDRAVIDAVAAAAGGRLLDVHTDPHHNRSVLTLLGEDAPKAVTEVAVRRIDLQRHRGVHPRIGAVDVVPFVPLDGSTMADAIAARDRFCAWAAVTLDLPCFAYGPERTLPDVRREAWSSLRPTTGPDRPHPTAGAAAVGARDVLVAYNVWLTGADLRRCRAIATQVRQPGIRALGLAVGDRMQVSMNLVDPTSVGPDAATDAVTEVAETVGASVDGCELVGLVPRAVLDAIRPDRWVELDLAPDRTIESRVRLRLSGGT